MPLGLIAQLELSLVAIAVSLRKKLANTIAYNILLLYRLKKKTLRFVVQTST